MKKLTKVLLPAIAALMCLMFAAGCNNGGKTGGTTKIIIWEDTKNIATVELLTDEFARMYKANYPKAGGLSFEIIPHSEKSAIEDMSIDAPGGNGPDIVALVHDTLGTAVEGGILAKNIMADKVAAQNIESALNAATYNGSVYGYPITSESQILIYQKNKISAAQAENIESIIGSGTGNANAKLIWDTLEGYYSFGIMTDALLYGDDQMTTTGAKSGYLNFATPQTISNINYVRTLKGNNLIVPGETSGSTDIEGLAKFLAGESDAIIVAPYFWASARERFGEAVAMAPLPKLNGVNLRPLSGYKLYGVSKYSTNPAVAQMLADFLTGEEAQAIRLRDKTLLPTNKNLLNKIENAGSGSVTVDNWRGLDTTKITIANTVIAQANIFRASLARSITMPSLPRFSAFWTAYANNMKTMWDAQSLTELQITTYLDKITENM